MRQVKVEVHYTVNVDEEDGKYWAEIEEIPGCFVSGNSMDEIRDALPEAMTHHLPAPDVLVTFRDVEGGDVPVAAAAGGSAVRGGADRGAVACRIIEHPATERGRKPGTVTRTRPTRTAAMPLGELVSMADHRPLRR